MRLPERDLSLLGTCSDQDLANLWGISRERVRQLRKQLNIPSYKILNAEIRNKKIIEYLKKNENKVINLKELKRELHIYSDIICQFYIKKLARVNNISIKLYDPEYIHGRVKYNKSECDCQICKLSHSISQRYYNNNLKCSAKFSDYIANNYLEFYLSDKSRYRQVFYSFVDQEMAKMNEIQNEQNETDTQMQIIIPNNFEIHDEVYVENVIKFAKSLPENVSNTLQNCFDRLSKLAEGYKANVKLYNDFAPYSFLFYIGNKLEGGVIFHGEHDNGGDGSAPTYSVCMTSQDGWTIHT